MVAVATVFLVTSVVHLFACLYGSPHLPFSCVVKVHTSIAMAAYVPSSANYMCHESKGEPYTLGAFASVLFMINGLLFFSHAVVAHQPVSGSV
ncbi:hypothetical protein IscW_ISCW016955 [Ixodes scapularis]|uniref:Uncharacterized protein n=1 Tax=Ixodes scapularis TaxID=6945 RepID=B7PBS0_IXOSC|nr:hypothetical protein IscW_ISCW016955 [Ixodes scapularis]|eukprot:XP_002408818.1 hypothetical protein IscW_ISCW016955 [Ixodes scapularis]